MQHSYCRLMQVTSKSEALMRVFYRLGLKSCASSNAVDLLPGSEIV